MREMRNTAADAPYAGNACQKFYDGEYQDEPFCLQGNRRENEGQYGIREKHGVPYQHTVYGTGSTHGRGIFQSLVCSRCLLGAVRNL